MDTFVTRVLEQSYEAMVRIVTSPTPYVYRHLLGTLVFSFVYAFPFAFVALLGWVVVPASMALCLGMYGVLALSQELENPLGRDDNDIDLAGIRDILAMELHGLYKFKFGESMDAVPDRPRLDGFAGDGLPPVVAASPAPEAGGSGGNGVSPTASPAAAAAAPTVVTAVSGSGGVVSPPPAQGSGFGAPGDATSPSSLRMQWQAGAVAFPGGGGGGGVGIDTGFGARGAASLAVSPTAVVVTAPSSGDANDGATSPTASVLIPLLPGVHGSGGAAALATITRTQVVALLQEVQSNIDSAHKAIDTLQGEYRELLTKYDTMRVGATQLLLRSGSDVEPALGVDGVPLAPPRTPHTPLRTPNTPLRSRVGGLVLRDM